MCEGVSVELCVGSEGRAEEWNLHLPKDSEAIKGFLDPVTLTVGTPRVVSGLPPEHPGKTMKVFVGDEPAWQDTGDVIDVFAQLWPEALQAVAEKSPGTVGLVSFAGFAVHEELLTLWPHLPFGLADDRRFFVSELCKTSRTEQPVSAYLSVEYAYEDFKRMVGPENFEYACGTTIKGLSVTEAGVATHLKRDIFDRATLEQVLLDESVRCWWFCDSDFEGLSLWHKDHTGRDLARHISNRILPCVEKQGLILKADI